MFILFFVAIFVIPSLSAYISYVVEQFYITKNFNNRSQIINLLKFLKIKSVTTVTDRLNQTFKSLMFQLFLYDYVVYLFYSFITLLGSFFNISYILLEQLFCISRRNYDLVSYFSTVSQYTVVQIPLIVTY